MSVFGQRLKKIWTPPVTRESEFTSLKPVESWTEAEHWFSLYNSKGLNVISSHITPEEYNIIMTYETSKEAWDTLALTHDGSSTVMAFKLQNLTTQFEMNKMLDSESFDEF